MYAIGIDIGTTSICGVVLDTESGQVVKSRTEMSNAFIPTANPWEKIQDTDKIIALAQEILESFKEYPAAVIGVTGQMHGIVYVDAQGHAISPLYTWQDAKGNLPYKDSTYAEYLGSFAGYGNVTDFYNRVNGVRPKEAAAYCTIMDYLVMVLCGLEKPRMHVTNAASLGCFDLKEKQFCSQADLSYDINASVSDSYEIVGYYKGIPVSIAIGDNQASVFSTLAEERDLLINVGTGSQVSVISDSIRSGANIETRPYFDGKYLVVGAALCGGRAYGMLKDFFGEFLTAAGIDGVDVYAVMERLAAGKEENSGQNDAQVTKQADGSGQGDMQVARQADGSGQGDMQVARQADSSGQEATQLEKHADGALQVDTRFAGTRQNPEQCGSISGINVNNFTAANLTYGFLEGMMEELHQMYGQMTEEKCSLEALPKINLVGSGNGIRKNKILVQIAEKKFDGKLRIPAHTEEAAYGAALFGLVACGAFQSAGQAQAMIRYEV